MESLDSLIHFWKHIFCIDLKICTGTTAEGKCTHREVFSTNILTRLSTEKHEYCFYYGVVTV